MEEHHPMLPAGQARAADPRIDWFAYNYPPGLRVVHFDLEELRVQVGEPEFRVAAALRRQLRLTVVVMLLNIVSTATLVSLGELRAVALAYAVGNLVLGGTWGASAMFQGYKGVAVDSPVCRKTARRLLLVAVAGAAVQALLSGGTACNSNGWFKLGYVYHNEYLAPQVQSLWIAVIVIESSLWGCVVALGAHSIRLLHAYAPNRVVAAL